MVGGWEAAPKLNAAWLVCVDWGAGKEKDGAAVAGGAENEKGDVLSFDIAVAILFAEGCSVSGCEKEKPLFDCDPNWKAPLDGCGTLKAEFVEDACGWEPNVNPVDTGAGTVDFTGSWDPNVKAGVVEVEDCPNVNPVAAFSAAG